MKDAMPDRSPSIPLSASTRVTSNRYMKLAQFCYLPSSHNPSSSFGRSNLLRCQQLFYLLVLFWGAVVAEHLPGDEICTEGYVMDLYSIQQGALLDSHHGSSLEAPFEHSVQSLVDVRISRSSPFEILHDPSGPEDSPFLRGFRLDDDSKETVVGLARQTGVCRTCTGEGEMVKGFRVGILGTVVKAADGDIPPVVAVHFAKVVRPAEEFCDKLDEILGPVVGQIPRTLQTTRGSSIRAAETVTSPTATPTPSSRDGLLCRILRLFAPNNRFCASSPTPVPGTFEPTTSPTSTTLTPTVSRTPSVFPSPLLSSEPTSSMAPTLRCPSMEGVLVTFTVIALDGTQFELNEGDTIELMSVGIEFDIKLDVSSPVNSLFVELDVEADGLREYTVLLLRPTYLLGDILEEEIAQNGTHTLTASPFCRDTASLGETFEITFDVVGEKPTSEPSGVSSRAPTTTPTVAPSSNPSKEWVLVETFTGNFSARHEACFVMVNEKGYLIGGRQRDPVDIYDPRTQTWTQGPGLPFKIHHSQCVAVDSKIYMINPWTDGRPFLGNLDRLWVYDTVSNEWESRTALPEPRRRGSCAAVLRGREIYVSHGNRGGHGNHTTTLTWFDKYNVDTDEWTTNLPDAPHKRDHTGAALVAGGRLMCVGGGRASDATPFANNVVLPTDCFNFETGGWEVHPDIPQGRAGSSYGQTCDGKLMVAGGEGFGRAWPNVDVYDGTSWTTIDSLEVERHGSGLAVSCACNQIHLASGSGDQGGRPELFSVETLVPGGVISNCTP